MGLDMYLYEKPRVICPHCGKEIDLGDWEEIVYWRKANAIHQWFVNHCSEGDLENLESCPVTKEQLIELRDACKKVVNSSELVQKTVKGQRYNAKTKDYEEVDLIIQALEDTSIAEDLLPTQSGYFFGNTQYDKYYIEQLEWTIDKLDEIIETTDFDKNKIEYSAWW